MANLITCCRILLSLLLLFFPALSPGFYGLYLAAGLSDMLDGYVARRTNSASPLGAKLDSMADLVFLAVCLIKLLPVLALPVWLWVWVGLIALLRLVNVVSGFFPPEEAGAAAHQGQQAHRGAAFPPAPESGLS